MKSNKSFLKEIILGLSLFFLSLVIFLYFANYDGVGDSITKAEIIEVDDNLPEIEVQGISLQQVSDHKSYVWKLNSYWSKIYKKINKIECDSIICSLIRDKKELATVKSVFALIDRNQDKAYLDGPVDCFYPGIELTSKKGVIDFKHNTVTMTDGVSSSITLLDKEQPHKRS